MEKLNILIVGGTGFIGRILSNALYDEGHNVTVLSRRLYPDYFLHRDIEFIQADVRKTGQWQEQIINFNLVINLAGTSIFRRWTEFGKKEILHSRIIAANNIVKALQLRKGQVQQFISVSGVGYYGFHGDEFLDENNQAGSDFLANVAAQWEIEIQKLQELGIRFVICRLGHVLGMSGGILPKLLTLAKLHMAGYWGNGQQWISWIHKSDLAKCICFLIDNRHISGPINVTAPNPVRNREMMQLLSNIVHKHHQMPMIPEFLLRLVAGEFSSVFIQGQRVIPHKLLHQGFKFDYPNLSEALNMLVNPSE
jgi:uncharacterized protein (TIGR01777 family)